MRTELSDLLREVAQDAPPPRYDINDAVRAGKRRQRRHRTGWLAGAALAVAVAVTVPQLLTHPRRTQPVTPTPSVTPVAKAPAINVTFAGYTAGRFTVSAPFRWTLAGLTAEVQKKGSDPANPEALLTVYHPGVADPIGWENGVKRTATTAIGGRPAYFATEKGGHPMLVWQYADDAYAIVAPAAGNSADYVLTKTDMRQLATAFRADKASPVTVPFRTAAVPDGYRLAEVDWAPDSGTAVFLPASVATPRISDVDHGPEPDTLGPWRDHIRIRAGTPVAGEDGGNPSSGIRCPNGRKGGFTQRCYRWLPGDKYVSVSFCQTADKGYLTRLADSLEFADPGKRATWFPVSQAFPASTQMGG
jgi:hypothetical protein